MKKTGRFYYFASNFNALCEIDLEQGAVRPVGSIPGEYFDTEFLISNIWEYKNRIVCIPFKANKFCMMDLSVEKEKVSFVCGGDAFGQRAYFNAYLKGRSCYLFPFTGSHMIQIDMEHNRVGQTVNVRKEYRDFSGNDYSYFSYSGCYAVENKVYMAMYDTPVIAEYEILSGNMHFYKIEGNSLFYINLAGYGHNIYVLGKDGVIYQWDVIEHKVKNITRVELKEGQNQRFRYSAKNGIYLYMFRYIPSDEFIRINTKTGQAEALSLCCEFQLQGVSGNQWTYMDMDGETFYFLSQNHEVYKMNVNTKQVDIIPLKLDETEMQKFLLSHESELFEKAEGIIPEGGYVWTLDHYINKHVDISKDSKAAAANSVGYRIYTATKWPKV